MTDYLTWFKGNTAARDLFNHFVELSHIWDDLVDKDKAVSTEQINRAFILALVVIPENPVYQALGQEMRTLFSTAIAGYLTANAYEETLDSHGLEIAHTLRYAVAHVFIFLITKLHGIEEAVPILQEAMKEMIPERFADYIKERQNA